MRLWRQISRHFATHPSTTFSVLTSTKLTQILQLCSKSRALSQAKQTHLQIIQTGLHQNPFVITKLIQCYAECDHLGYAQKLFDELSEPNVFAWTAFLAFYSRNGMFSDCLQCYRAMRFQGVAPDQYVFPKVLRACAQLSDFDAGGVVHKEVIVYGTDLNLEVFSSLIDMYSKCGRVESARQIFDSMAARDLLSWNAMISGYVANGLPESAVELFGSMRIQPDTVTLNSVMDAYFRMQLCDEAVKVFRQISRPSIISWTTLISGHSRAGNHEASLGVFRDMMQAVTISADVDALSTAMVSCRVLRALRTAQEIHAYGIKKHCKQKFYKSAGPSLLTLYSRCGRLHDVKNVFELMDMSDVVAWNAMILGFIDLAMPESALEAFYKMQASGIKIDRTTVSTILPTCDLKSGRQIHAYILRNNFGSEVSVLNALISMYSKCGSVHAANVIFCNMFSRDLVSWNTMIGGFAMHGKGEAALKLLQEMIFSGLRPNSVTLIAALSACSHSGLVNEGLEIFYRMRRDFDITPKMEHFSCIVDMLARYGQLEEAFEVVKGMPMCPNKSIWGTLLAAGEAQQNVEVATLAAENLVIIEPENAGHYVTLSNIYAKEDRWDDAMRIRKSMEGKGLMKFTGSSWT